MTTWLIVALAVLGVVVLGWLVVWLVDARRAEDEATDTDRFRQ